MMVTNADINAATKPRPRDQPLDAHTHVKAESVPPRSSPSDSSIARVPPPAEVPILRLEIGMFMRHSSAPFPAKV